MEENKTESAPVQAPLSKIDEAKALVERIEKANAEFKGLLERQEALKINQMLSGTTEAGKEPEKKEETPAEYAKRMEKGEL